MNDALNRPLTVGDEILAIVAHGRNSGGSFSRGKITRLTEHNVFFMGSDYSGYVHRERKVDPSKVVKIV